MPRIDLQRKPICITGASSGIGRATALACAMAGMPVALQARTEENLRRVQREIESAGAKALIVPGDVSDQAACQRLIDDCMEQFGSVYAVFANAGYGEESAVHDMSDEAVREMFEINFFGTLNTIRPALPHMRSVGAGHVLICSSCVAKFPMPYFSIYSATKAAQHHISRAMALELKAAGIHVSSIHPVGTKTEFFNTARQRSGGNDYQLIEHTRDAFMQTPETVARAIVRCLRRPRPEVWTSMPVRYGMSIASMMPRVSDFFVHRMVKRRSKLDAQGKGAQPTSAAEP